MTRTRTSRVSCSCWLNCDAGDVASIDRSAEIFQSPVCIVSIAAGNAAATVLAAIRKSRQVAEAATASPPAATANNDCLSVLWREVIFPRQFDRHGVRPLSEAPTTRNETASDHSYKPATRSLSPRGAAACRASQPRRYRCRTLPAGAQAGGAASAPTHGARRLRARVVDGVHRWDGAARCVTEIAR